MIHPFGHVCSHGVFLSFISFCTSLTIESFLALIPVHTRVLFDILQEAYRSKSIEKSTKLSDQIHVNDENGFPSFNDLLLTLSSASSSSSPTPVAQATTNRGHLTSPSSNIDLMTSVEPINISRLDRVRLEKIFPQSDTTLAPTSETDESDLLVDELKTTMKSYVNFDDTSIAGDQTDSTGIHEDSATSSETLSVIDNSTVVQNDDNQEGESTKTIENENSTVQTDSDPNTQTTEIKEPTMESTTNSRLESFTTESEKTTPSSIILETTVHHSDATLKRMNVLELLDDGNDQSESKTTEIVNDDSTTPSVETLRTTIEELTSTASMTTEIPIQVEELLKALNSSESLRNRLLYKLCRQLLSHIIPNKTSSSMPPLSSSSLSLSESESVAMAKQLASNSSISINHTADALLSWINEQLTSTFSTEGTPTMNTKTTLTTSDFSKQDGTTTMPSDLSSLGNIPTLLIEESPSPSVSLQRVDMTDVLGQMNSNIEADFIS